MPLLNQARFLQFLLDELDLSPASIAVATKLSQRDHAPLSVVLWHCGLVTLEQLNQIFEWLEPDNQY
jgi:hypothetical protein